MYVSEAKLNEGKIETRARIAKERASRPQPERERVREIKQHAKDRSARLASAAKEKTARLAHDLKEKAEEGVKEAQGDVLESTGVLRRCHVHHRSRI